MCINEYDRVINSFFGLMDDSAMESLSGKLILKRDSNVNLNNSHALLYHAAPCKLSVIKPNSLCIGNRIDGKHYASFWMSDISWSISFVLSCLALIANDDDDIKFSIVDSKYLNGRNLPNFMFAIPPYEYLLKNKKPVLIDKLIFELNKRHPFYIHCASIPISDIYAGQTTDEYTIRRDVVPDKVIKCTTDMLKKHIMFLSEEDMQWILDNYPFACHPRKGLEKLIFKDPVKTILKREKLLNKK